MKKYIPEILKEINSDTSKIKDYEEKKPLLSLLFKYAFDPEYKFLLPEGDPPFEPNPDNIGLNGLLTAEIKKLYVYTKENPNIVIHLAAQSLVEEGINFPSKTRNFK